MPVTAPYPAHLEADIVLRTGRTLHLRPVRRDDADAMRRFFTRLSPAALHSRFFDVRSVDAALGSAPLEVDFDDVAGMVGVTGDEIVAVAHYFRSRKHRERAEVAFTIADSHQGEGIATRLLERLAAHARSQGVTRFVADVLATNRAMIDVFADSGFTLEFGSREGVVHVSLALDPTALFADRSAQRSQIAASASMQPIFAPRSIAVIGASRKRGNLGTEIVHNLVANGFKGALYAVNPQATTIEGVPCCPSIAQVPEAIELAIIAVPAPLVEQVIDQCVAKGVRAAIVISAGFGETGDAGRAMEARLVEKARAAGMRMVGPNCMGVLNTDPAVSMQATFVQTEAGRGNIAMSSQSGAIGVAVLDYARALNVGFSSFISVGNKADVSGNDLIQYWAEDPSTDVILLYLESFGNPRKFAEIARRVSRRKPIVAVKAGRSAAGARAAQSHTGALAASDAIVADLCRQAGIIRVDTLEEMFDVGALLSQQQLPAGRRVGIITNAGGAGILAADACEARGLTLPTPPDHLQAELRSFLPPAASVGNPVDMIASASAEDYRRAIRAMLDDDTFDTVLVIYIPVTAEAANAVGAAIRECAQDPKGKTILATYMGAHSAPLALSPVPAFPFPERAVAALGRAVTYAEWRRKPAGVVPAFADIDGETIRRTVEAHLESEGAGWLDSSEVTDVLRALSITLPQSCEVYDADEAVRTADVIGYPVVLKAMGPSLLHKTEKEAVILNLGDPAEVREAYLALESRLGDAMTSGLVQQMITKGVEAMVGATEQATFGHVLAYGAGGTLIELLGDVAFRLHPLTDSDAEAMLAGVRFTRLLQGFRGSPACDEAVVRETLLRISAMLTVCPEIREIDINPLKVQPQGAVALDARIRVAPYVPDPPTRRVSY